MSASPTVKNNIYKTGVLYGINVKENIYQDSAHGTAYTLLDKYTPSIRGRN